MLDTENNHQGLKRCKVKFNFFVDFSPAFIKTESVVRRCFLKNVFIEISQSSQENTCARVSFLNTSGGCLCKKGNVYEIGIF